MAMQRDDDRTDALLRALARTHVNDAASARARVDALLAAEPTLVEQGIHVAAAVGAAAAVRRLVAEEPSRATACAGPFGWDPLTHLCFSVRLGSTDTEGREFVDAARALLEFGANANTGYDEPGHRPAPEFASVLYGAAGIAHHAALTRLLLEHGADPNDEEVAYHAPEGYDGAAMHALVESGRATPDTLATMLLRKCDWHDVKGVRWLLERGADPSRATRWTRSIVKHALTRDNDLEIIQLLLDHGADPAIASDGVSAISAAARAGRGDVLDAMARRGIPLRIDGGDALLAACARGHGPAVHTIVETLPAAAEELRTHAGPIMSRFAGNGNSTGLRFLLELGLPVDVLNMHGDPYFDVPPRSTPLHVAAWRGRPAAVRLLLGAGADPHAQDGRGQTALELAVRACVDSYWTDRRTPESVEALLTAGAAPDRIALPTGYEAVDLLLRAAARS